MLPFLNPLPIMLSLVTMFGVLFHDTQFDHAAVTALATPVSISSYGSAETAMRLDDNAHTHTERANFSNSLPVLQPRTLTDKKYILHKGILSRTSDEDYHWPTV